MNQNHWGDFATTLGRPLGDLRGDVGNLGLRVPPHSQIHWLFRTTGGAGSYGCACVFVIALATVARYTPGDDAWEPVADMPTARDGLAAVALGGLIYAVGGQDDDGNFLASVERYDPLKYLHFCKVG